MSFLLVEIVVVIVPKEGLPSFNSRNMFPPNLVQACVEQQKTYYDTKTVLVNNTHINKTTNKKYWKMGKAFYV